MTAPATLETARRVRELAGPRSSELVRTFLARVEDHGGDLEAFLEGMLAVLDPETFLARAAKLVTVETVAAPKRFPGECRKGSDRETVIRFCRDRLGLREDGEDAHREKFTGTYEDRTDDGEVWIFFPRRPQADVRAKVKAAGFWYMGAEYGRGWRHRCASLQQQAA